jgi:predicted transcriptional regulator
MTRKANYEELEKFKQAMEMLRTRYTTREIANELGTDAANLSSYVTGNKTPGAITLQKFNDRFEKEVRLLFETYGQVIAENINNLVEEPASPYSTAKKHPVKRGAQTDNAIKRGPHKGKAVKSRQPDFLSSLENLVAANMSMASSMEKLAQSNLILAETNRSLLVKTPLKTRKKKITKR